MTMTTPTLQWSESEPPAEVRTGEQLDQLLERLTASAQPEFPISVRLQAHDCEADAARRASSGRRVRIDDHDG
jgi:hypothetical protein